MKKVLLSMIAAAAVISASAQQRLVLYEEFSGENCGPCAAYNPGLMTLLNANASKTILIKYQSPIPSAGPIYYQNTADVQSRLTYYNVPFAPYGRQDGAQVGDGNIANHTQAAIDAAYAVPTVFNITATHTISSDWDSVYLNVTVASTGTFNGTTMKLRAALVEDLEYDYAPGSNGETEFHHVMRKMYPDATGSTANNSWTNGSTQSFTIGGVLPAYVDKSRPIFFIVWLQDDANKVVAQAGKSAPVATVPLDVMSDSMVIATPFLCAAGTASVTPTVAIKNTGTTPLTTAAIYTKIDNGTWTLSQTWTGNLAAGASTSASLTALSVTPGSHVIYDSVAMPNTTADINPVNNVSYSFVTVANTNTNPLTITTGFENGGQLPTNYIMYDAANNGGNWRVVYSTSGNVGHNNSTYLIQHNNYSYPVGEANYAILPTPDLTTPIRSIDFWVAYAQYDGTENDRLDVVYTTNCGQNWTSIWNKSGANLKTRTPVGNNTQFVPAQTEWRQESVSLNSVPAGAMVAFKGTSDFGNNLYIDDIVLRAGSPLGVEVFNTSSASIKLFPNPAQDKATLSFFLDNNVNVTVQVLDAVGRLVATVANGNMDKGQQSVEINTANFAAGAYNVVIKTDAGTATQRLTVTK